MRAEDLLSEPWAFGPWCWVIDEVRLLPEPLFCRGLQGIWPIGHTLNDHEVAWEVSTALHAIVPELARREWTALTLLQPYASAIAIGPKRIENRPWSRRVPPGGMWIGLHAGKALYDRGADLLLEWQHVGGLWPEVPTLSELPLGAMLGAMHVAQILPYPERAP